MLVPALLLFSKQLKVVKATQAKCYTQCTNCYHFGHAAACCTQEHPTCPYCELHHTRSAHRCQNHTWPKGGDSRAVPHCWPMFPLTAPTAATTTMPSTRNAGLDQSLHLNPWPPPLPTKNYPTPDPTVREPWI